MGYDCTLHLIDERAIARELIPRLVKTKLVADPEDAARVLTARAVQFAAAALPHLAARGYAFSLLRTLPPTASSPEPLFAAIVAERRDLKGHFPTQFTENYMTGVFIPAAKIAATRQWIERRRASFSAAERAPVEAIERVLAAAEKHGLGYWEATDLAVKSVKSDWLALPKPISAGFWKANLERIVGRDGDVVFAHDAKHRLVVVDLGTPRPKLSTFPIDFATLVVRDEDGWLLVERRQDTRPFSWHLFRRVAKLSAKPSLAAPEAIADPFIAGGEIYARAETKLVRYARGKFVSVVGAPASNGSVAGGAGDVIVWNGDGWEMVNAKPKKTFSLAAGPSYVDWTCVPDGPNAFYYLSKRRIFRAERGKKPKRVAAKVSNVMSLAAGLDGALYAVLGDNQKRWTIASIRSGAATPVPTNGPPFQDVLGVASTVNGLYVLMRTGIARL